MIKKLVLLQPVFVDPIKNPNFTTLQHLREVFEPHRLRRFALLTGVCLLAMPLAGIANAAPSGDGMGRARFSWDAVPDPIVSGYKVHWGTASGVYTHKEEAANTTELIVTGFSEGGEYFAAVTAYSATGEESDYSTEISFIYEIPDTTITFTSQPQPQLVAVGQAADFSVTATGSGALTYQWQKGGAVIAGATDSTYTIVSPMVIDAGSYTVVVTNAGESATSDAAALIVNPATPLITEVPVAAAINYGQALAGATLSGGTASVAGSFAFVSPAFVPTAGTTNQAVIFTPSDTENYNTATAEVGVTVIENFDFWCSGYSGLGEQTAPADDPDGDGIVNLMEYALAGGDPGSSNCGILPVVSILTDGNLDYLALTVQKNPTSNGVNFVVEVSGDLLDWTAGVGHTVIVGETANTLIVRDHTPVSGSTSRFIRLKVASGQP